MGSVSIFHILSEINPCHYFTQFGVLYNLPRHSHCKNTQYFHHKLKRNKQLNNDSCKSIYVILLSGMISLGAYIRTKMVVVINLSNKS